MSAGIILEAHHLVVNRGGTRVLEIPSFVLREAEVLSLIGPNGAGKSTLLLTLSSLLKPQEGEIRYRGGIISPGRAAEGYRRRMSMVFQEPLLFDTTVFENVATGLKMRGMARSEIRSRVFDTLELFDIGHLADRSARKLSGGEAQRTSLARAFAVRPEIILLDEPFSSLDPPTRLGLTEDLEHILRETGTAAIITTHDQLEALRLSNRMAVMNGGRIIQSGNAVEVMHHPADEFVAAFVGMENILKGTAAAQGDGVVTVEVAGQHVHVPGSAFPGTELLFCIRPEYVTIEISNPDGATSARNVFSGNVRKIVPMGMYHKVELDCGFPLVAYVTAQSVGNLRLEPGRSVFASFKATAVHLLRQGGLQDE